MHLCMPASCVHLRSPMYPYPWRPKRLYMLVYAQARALGAPKPPQNSISGALIEFCVQSGPPRARTLCRRYVCMHLVCISARLCIPIRGAPSAYICLYMLRWARWGPPNRPKTRLGGP